MQMSKMEISRRDFLKGAAAGAASHLIVFHVIVLLGTAAIERQPTRSDVDMPIALQGNIFRHPGAG